MNPTIITDNLECIQIFREAGIMEEIDTTPESRLPLPFTSVSLVFQHRGEWCIGKHDMGHADPKENGYTVIRLPGFGRMQAEEFRVALDLLSRDVTKPPVCVIEQVNPKPPTLVAA